MSPSYNFEKASIIAQSAGVLPKQGFSCLINQYHEILGHQNRLNNETTAQTPAIRCTNASEADQMRIEVSAFPIHIQGIQLYLKQPLD